MIYADLSAGGLVAFSGGTSVRKAGLLGATLSFLIEKITRSKLSHVAIVPPAFYWHDSQPWILESTIWKGVSGPQFNPLPARLHADYELKGGHASYLAFQPAFEPNWPDLWAHGQQMIQLQKAGKLHYSVKRLFADAVNRSVVFDAISLPAAGIIERLSQADHGLVCSECAGLLMQGGGVNSKAVARGIPWLPAAVPIAGQPIGCSPQDLEEMPIWATPIPIL